MWRKSTDWGGDMGPAVITKNSRACKTSCAGSRPRTAEACLPSAGDAEHCAGHVGGGVREEEEDGLGNLRGGAGAAGRHQRRQAIDPVGLAGRGMNLGQDETGRYRVDAD